MNAFNRHRHEHAAHDHLHPSGNDVYGILFKPGWGGAYVDVGKRVVFCSLGREGRKKVNLDYVGPWLPIVEDVTPEQLRHAAYVLDCAADAIEEGSLVQTALEAYEALTPEQKETFMQRLSSVYD